jgi:riboflavin kinase/FMN adenylyltransferase
LKIVEGLWDAPLLERPTVLTFGTFDALHIGHQAILQRVVRIARDTSRHATALFFHPNPLRVIAPERCPPTLSPLSKKLRLLESFGLDVAVVARFDERLRSTEPGEFVGLLVSPLRAEMIVVGHDARFGHGARGDERLLRALGGSLGLAVEVVDAVQFGGAPVSSTRVREALRAGDLSLVRQLLGRSYSVEGTVVVGDGRGRALGFPTANVEVGEDQQLPPTGIYAAEVVIGERAHGAAVSLGLRPTFGAGRLVLEAHVLDFAGDLYGQEVEVVFLWKIREERRFETVDALTAEMRRDVAATRAFLANRQDRD